NLDLPGVGSDLSRSIDAQPGSNIGRRRVGADAPTASRLLSEPFGRSDENDDAAACDLDEMAAVENSRLRHSKAISRFFEELVALGFELRLVVWSLSARPQSFAIGHHPTPFVRRPRPAAR